MTSISVALIPCNCSHYSILIHHTLTDTPNYYYYGDYNALLNLQLETILLILRILQYFYMYHVFLISYYGHHNDKEDLVQGMQQYN